MIGNIAIIGLCYESFAFPFRAVLKATVGVCRIPWGSATILGCVSQLNPEAEGVMSTIPVALSGTGEIPIIAEDREIDGVRRVLFFDGVCGLCSWSIDFVLKRDLKEEFQFAPLQGDTAKAMLSSADVNDLDTMVLWVAGRTYRKSAAVTRILWHLGPWWRFVGMLLWLIPLPVRNLGYTIVAKNRYRVFGKKETCRLPTPAERARFLP